MKGELHVYKADIFDIAKKMDHEPVIVEIEEMPTRDGKSQFWSTPPDFYKKLDDEFHFTFDPCPLHADFDGLAVAWTGRVFVNPPYSNIGAFLDKARRELAAGNAELVVFLVPVRTDTRWFHNHVLHRSEIRFLVGRLKFGGGEELCSFSVDGCGV